MEQIIFVAFIAAAIFALYEIRTHLTQIKAALHIQGNPVLEPPTPIGNGDPIQLAPPVDHGATPPANAGSTGSLVGQPVPGGDVPDQFGAIAIAAIAAKFPPNKRFLTVASLPYVEAGGIRAFCISANCSNSQFSAEIGGLPLASALWPIANPAGSLAIGAAAFHLPLLQLHEPVVPIPNIVVIPANYTTVDQIVAAYSKSPDWKFNPAGPGRLV